MLNDHGNPASSLDVPEDGETIGQYLVYWATTAGVGGAVALVLLVGAVIGLTVLASPLLAYIYVMVKLAPW